jgi:F-type H+-transporting ATPase subunit delta
MLDEEQGIAHVRVKTAVPLTDEEREALAQRLQQLTGRRVVLETEVDEGIIGGLVVQIGDRIIDGSTRSQLLALRRQLEEARV